MSNFIESTPLIYWHSLGRYIVLNMDGTIDYSKLSNYIFIMILIVNFNSIEKSSIFFLTNLNLPRSNLIHNQLSFFFFLYLLLFILFYFVFKFFLFQSTFYLIKNFVKRKNGSSIIVEGAG